MKRMIGLLVVVGVLSGCGGDKSFNWSKPTSPCTEWKHARKIEPVRARKTEPL